MESFAKGMLSQALKANKAKMVPQTFTEVVTGFYHAVRWSEVGSLRLRVSWCA